MKEEREKKIFDKYPELYRQRTLPCTQTCMCWGLAVGDGWADIVERMSTRLDEFRKRTGQPVEVAQVKEKFGLLRVYLEAYDEETSKIVAEAEEESAKVCEHCGKPGKMRKGGWIRTLCDECHEGEKRE